jgi:hypothetical protein
MRKKQYDVECFNKDGHRCLVTVIAWNAKSAFRQCEFLGYCPIRVDFII